MTPKVEKFADGTSSSFSTRKAGWNVLGVDATEAQTADDALRMAQLDWTVTKETVQAVAITNDGVERLTFADKWATVRHHPKTGTNPLAIVGSRYTILQNSEAFAFCNDLVDEGGAVFESAGSLNNGRKVFVTMRLPQDILVGGQDAVNSYLLVTNTHDGTEPLTAVVTNIRLACMNQLSAAIRSAKSSFRLRHSMSLDGRLQEARTALALSWRYDAEFEKLANDLLETPMSDKEYLQFVDRMFPDGSAEMSQKATTLSETRRSELMGLWRADTQANIAGTAWAAYNSVVEYVDWFTPVRGKRDAELRRAERALENKGQAVKARAFNALVSA